jgi:ABC-type amino acid transport system permease subunit
MQITTVLKIKSDNKNKNKICSGIKFPNQQFDECISNHAINVIIKNKTYSKSVYYGALMTITFSEIFCSQSKQYHTSEITLSL